MLKLIICANNYILQYKTGQNIEKTKQNKFNCIRINYLTKIIEQ